MANKEQIRPEDAVKAIENIEGIVKEFEDSFETDACLTIRRIHAEIRKLKDR